MQALTDEELEREADLLEHEARMHGWEQHENEARGLMKRNINQVDDPEVQGDVSRGETPAQLKVSSFAGR